MCMYRRLFFPLVAWKPPELLAACVCWHETEGMGFASKQEMPGVGFKFKAGLRFDMDVIRSRFDGRKMGHPPPLLCCVCAPVCAGNEHDGHG